MAPEPQHDTKEAYTNIGFSMKLGQANQVVTWLQKQDTPEARALIVAFEKAGNNQNAAHRILDLQAA